MDGGGKDLAAPLARLPLTPFDARQRDKQWRAGFEALERAGEVDAAILGDARLGALRARALEVANGNPGLQDLLTRPLFAGEFDAVAGAIEQIEGYLARGEEPEEKNAAFEFFRRMTFRRYREALAPAEVAMLRAVSVFGEGVWPDDMDAAPLAGLDLGVVPIPAAALEAAGAAFGVGDPAAARIRLAGLGLLDAYAAGSDAGHGAEGFAINRFARPLVEPLDPDERQSLAEATLPTLAETWRDKDGAWPADPRAVEATRLALLDPGAPEPLDPACDAAGRALADGHANAAAFALRMAAIDRLRTRGATPSPWLTMRAADLAATLGHGAIADRLLGEAAPERNAEPTREMANLLARRGRRRTAAGDPDAALADFAAAAGMFAALGILRDAAVCRGGIADVLAARGDTDEALRIRREEMLPVFARLGDLQSRAFTMGRIADVLQTRGEIDEALRVRYEEELPVYERLGDVRSRAVTMGQIADVLQARGDTDEALRIRYEEQLPVFERLGDVRSRALTMGRIADVLQVRGEIDEALRIRYEEQLPVYERLGDIRARAVTMGKIADVLQVRGDTDEALRIRREEELPAYERLGDVRSRAVTLQKIAMSLLETGGLGSGAAGEILASLAEAFAIFERLGIPDGIAFTGAPLCQVLASAGRREEALEVLGKARAAFERLENVKGIAFCDELRGQIEGGRDDDQPEDRAGG